MPARFPLSTLADRASADPFYFGRQIAAYLARRGLTLETLAAEWGVSDEVMSRIRLCGAVRTAEQARQVAERFGVREELVREVLGWG